MITALIIILILWISMGFLQYFMMKQIFLARYPNLGSQAFDMSDKLLFGILGFIVSPVFFIAASVEYWGDKEKIAKMRIEKKIEKMKTKKTIRLSKKDLRILTEQLTSEIQQRNGKCQSLKQQIKEKDSIITSLMLERTKLRERNEELIKENIELTKKTGSSFRFSLMEI